MATVTDRVTDEARSLPTDARLGLVEKLLTSLNPPTAEEIDLLWAEEAERRVAQIDAGDAKLLSGQAVFERIRATHGQ